MHLTSKIVRLKLFVKILFTCATNMVCFYTHSKDVEIWTTFLFLWLLSTFHYKARPNSQQKYFVKRILKYTLILLCR